MQYSETSRGNARELDRRLDACSGVEPMFLAVHDWLARRVEG
jgi:hypothetical protein